MNDGRYEDPPHKFLSVNDYGLKFTEKSLCALEMVKDISSKIRLCVASLGHALSIEGRVALLIRNMDI